MLTKEQLGDRLRETIMAKNKSQNALAVEVGSSPAKISNYVRGITFPPVDVLAEIARVLNVSLDYLCGLDNPQATPPASPQSLGDVARSLFAMRLWYTISFEKVTVSELRRTNPTDEYPEFIDVPTTYPALIFKSGELRSFVEDWQKVNRLFIENTFDNNFYNRWVEDRLNSLDSISIETQDLFFQTLESVGEDSIDQLPF